jgi:hypothetical protein
MPKRGCPNTNWHAIDRVGAQEVRVNIMEEMPSLLYYLLSKPCADIGCIILMADGWRTVKP